MIDDKLLEALARECNFGGFEVGVRLRQLASLVWWHGFEAGRKSEAALREITEMCKDEYASR